MKKSTLRLIYFYQKWLSLFLKGALYLVNRSCRFTPTCSQYASEAIGRYGIIKGAYLGLRRFLRCHPFAQGGVDFLR